MKHSMVFGLIALGTILPAYSYADNVDLKSGLEYYEKAKLLRNGDPAQYKSYLQKAVANDIPAAIIEQGDNDLLQTSNRLRSLDHIITKLEALVKRPMDQYFTPAQLARTYYLLGWVYENGINRYRDRYDAIRYYAQAARTESDARIALARMLKDEKTLITAAGQDADMFLLYMAWQMDPKHDQNILQQLQTEKKLNRWENNLIAQSAAGDTQATVYLAMHYLEGNYFPKRKAKGIEYLMKAADAGNAVAQMKLAQIYQNGEFNVQKDPKKSIEYYRQARKDSRFTNLATTEQVKLLPQDCKNTELLQYLIELNHYDQALKLFPQNSDTYVNPVILYLNAKKYEAQSKLSGKFNKNEYFRLLDMACNAGSEDAKEARLLAQSYQPDHLLAIRLNGKLDDKSADFLYETGTLALRCCKKGKARPEDALKLLNLAADKGSIQALYLLYMSYAKGSPVLKIKKDPAIAQKYAERLIKADIYGIYQAPLKDEFARLPQDSDALNMLLLRSAAHSPAAIDLLAKRSKNIYADAMLTAMIMGQKEAPSQQDFDKKLSIIEADLRKKAQISTDKVKTEFKR